MIEEIYTENKVKWIVFGERISSMLGRSYLGILIIIHDKSSKSNVHFSMNELANTLIAIILTPIIIRLNSLLSSGPTGGGSQDVKT